MEPQKQDSDEVMEESFKSKTEASIEAKGDKSYYYWHKHIPKSVPVEPPQLLRKETTEMKPEESWEKIVNWSWMDDEALVKVFLDLAKIGEEKQGVKELNAENVTCNFGTKSLEVSIRNYKGQNHQLKISNLKEDIDPNGSKHRVTTSKIIITLKKVDKEKTWWDLERKFEPF